MTTRRYQPSPLQQVDLLGDGDHWSLVFTRDFPQTRDAVWTALTNPDELREWAPYTADRPLTTPGPVTLIMMDGDTRQELPGEIAVADQPTLLEFTWGTDVLRWELTDNTFGTRLRLTHQLSDRAMAAMMAAGWHMCLDVAALLLAGTPIGPIVGEEAMNHGWSDLNKQYAERLNVEPIDPPVGR
ncbi:SRPBCC family protein [Nocardia amamiensis]|uniref:SRPBCC family protein n=1 Tax=Nocardia amamiensis TaxID=404578 RepID=UPI000835C0C9|nr:SRPBCC family protein [Nocardia amamiensis]